MQKALIIVVLFSLFVALTLAGKAHRVGRKSESEKRVLDKILKQNGLRKEVEVEDIQPEVTQTGPPAKCVSTADRVLSLPYWRVGEQFPCMYAGTVNTKADTDHHLFYWMFKNQVIEDASLVIWLNGGPGSSSMVGNFIENGPIRIEKTGDTNDDFELYMNPEGSWVDVAHMVFLDQPIEVGFSYGSPVLLDMQEGADEFVQFLLGLYQLHPELADVDLYVFGESYAGKYVPIFCETIINYNKDHSDEFTFNLQGCGMGDPYTAPQIQNVNTYRVARGLNLLDDGQMTQLDALLRHCEEQISANPGEVAAVACNHVNDYIEDVAAGVLIYDTRIFGYDWDPVEAPVPDYLNNNKHKETLYEDIHITDSPKDPKYVGSSTSVYFAYNMQESEDYTSKVSFILENNIPFIIYAGEFDVICGPLTVEDFLGNIQLVKDNPQFLKDARNIYYIKDEEGNQLVGGYYKQIPLLTWFIVPKSGHFVPANYMIGSKVMLADFIANKQLVCHSDNDDCNLKEAQCTQMNDCNGNGDCANGFCECNPGFTSADCSAPLVSLSDGYDESLASTGIEWFYFAFLEELGAGESLTLTLASEGANMDVY